MSHSAPRILLVEGETDQSFFIELLKKLQLDRFDFSSSPQPKAGGIVFPHNDGLADFGLWVMPNNAGEGALENWFLDCAHPNSQPLLDHAKTTIANLGAYSRFKQPHHLCKAQLATWLAWEQSPGEGLWRAFRDDLLDEGNPAFQGLCAWLQYVYSQAR